MTTLKKRTLAVVTASVFGISTLAVAFAAADGQSFDDHFATIFEPAAKSPALSVETTASSKGDLKIDLSDVKERRTHCISGDAQTKCIGWSVASNLASDRP